jgi:signal recognition particle receptor subunit beta
VVKLNEIKVAILGKDDGPKAKLIKNMTENARTVNFAGMSSGIDMGFTTVNGRRIYLFGATSEERKRFFEEVLPAGIDLGVVIVDSGKGISGKDKKIIDEIKDKKMQCLVFFNDRRENEFHNFGGSVFHGSAENRISANRLLDFFSKIS